MLSKFRSNVFSRIANRESHPHGEYKERRAAASAVDSRDVSPRFLSLGRGRRLLPHSRVCNAKGTSLYTPLQRKSPYPVARGRISFPFRPRREGSFLFVAVARSELTWKALFVAGRQKGGGRRDGRRRVPAGHDIRLRRVARRKLQDLLLLLAPPTPAAARRERFHGRQEADPAHVFAPRRSRSRVISVARTTTVRGGTAGSAAAARLRDGRDAVRRPVETGRRSIVATRDRRAAGRSIERGMVHEKVTGRELRERRHVFRRD